MSKGPLPVAALLVFFLVASAAIAADDEVKLEVAITAEQTGDPITNATVYLKYEEKRFLRKNKKLEFSSKTNDEGKAVFPPVPEGRVLVQIVAKGWKTYGKYYEIEGPKQTLEVKLQPVKRWY
ncbi:MAG: carboxypeptidase-like regulatory domain-containing protein [Candidatus Acidiferrales bacterium]